MTIQESTQILSHPRWGQFFKPGSDDELIFNARMIWVKVVNKAALGLLTLTEDHKESIRSLNVLLVKHGWEPLHSDFENL